MFKRTTAVNKILAMKARKRVIRGGTSSGKTYAIIPILIDRALRSKKRILIVAETVPAVREGACDIFKEVMQETGRWDDSCWNATLMKYSFKNGSWMKFGAYDTEGKAKAAGKRDIVFFNECNHIPFPIVSALMIRSEEIYFDYNPDNEFWIDTEILTQPNAELLVLTYKDNQAIPKAILHELLLIRAKAYHNPKRPLKTLNDPDNIKSTYWANWWRVYGLGEIGSLQGVVFDDWKQTASIPPEAKLLGYGMDFGYTNDPTTLVAVYELNGEIYLEELIYEKGMKNADIARRCNTLHQAGLFDKNAMIYADSAEPKSIDELKELGLRITGADKGKDSINFGIQRIQERTVHVLSTSLNLIKELRRYKWAVDRTGATLNVPIDAYNHAIDAVRYFFATVAKYTGKYVVSR